MVGGNFHSTKMLGKHEPTNWLTKCSLLTPWCNSGGRVERAELYCGRSELCYITGADDIKVGIF